MLDAAPCTRLDHHNPDPFQERNAAPCGCNSTPRWTVVTVWPQAERYATSNLQRQGHVAYLPLYPTRLRHRLPHTLQRTIFRPMFPGYLFVQHDPAVSWTPIRITPGVRSMLRNGNQLQYANAGDLEAVRAAEEAGRITPTSHPHQWAPGAPVALLAGALRGHPAVVLATHGDHATVAVLLFGALRQVSAPIAWLVARQ
jgi:transcription antitermination factor NusG